MRKLMNLPYNVILISHEDTTKDLTKRTGDKVTKVMPNIADKVAKKLAGMVDVVIRTIKVGNEYTISTKTSDVIFGGGRLDGMKAVDMPNCWASIDAMYASVTAQKAPEAAETADEEDVPAQPTERVRKAAEPVEEVAVTETPAEEQPKRRTRRTRQ
jgi:hypothetical protein